MSFNAAFPVGLDVQWQSPEQLPVGNAHLKNWLLDTGSLTERVQALSSKFSLELLGQKALMPHSSELQLLESNNSVCDDCVNEKSYQIREILLCNNGQPWVFARSVIPQAIIDAELSNLGKEPLGKRLFNDARFKRSDFEITSMPASQLGYAQSQSKESMLWGRRSRFTLGNHSMIVAEVFLPNSPAYSTMPSSENLL
ncbi:MAG: chorismate lyase [Pseudomonadota bacterium]|nr:chorismate lyase [Pseudomonadota bacterium]